MADEGQLATRIAGPGPPSLAESGVTSTEIRAHLSRILQNPHFQKCERMSCFLRFVVMQTLEGKADRIKQRTVAMEVYGRSTGFDPRIDPIVRIEATRLRRLLAEYYANDGATDSIEIGLPKGGYVPSFRRRDHIEPSTNPKREVQWLSSRHGGPSIAVFFLANTSRETEADYLPIGITEELITSLTCYKDLVVIGPLEGCSDFSKSLRQAREARARFVLLGKVQQVQTRLRISVSLSETQNGTTLWSEKFDRDLDSSNLLALQDEIASTIAGTVADDFGVLTRALTESSKATKTTSPRAFDAVLQARSWVHALNNEALSKAKQALEIAVGEDPGFALTKALLSDIYAIDYHLDLGLTGHHAPLDVAERLAREAVTLDPFCQTSAWCLAGVHFHRRRRELCIAELERTLSLNPNHPSSNGNCGLFFTMLGDHQRGITLIRKAMRLNPHHPSWYHLCLFMDAYRRGEFAESLKEAAKFQSPDLFWPPLMRAAALGQLGQVEAAAKEGRECLARFPDFADRGAEVMRLTVYTDDHVEGLLDGLAKAGLPMPQDR